MLALDNGVVNHGSYGRQGILQPLNMQLIKVLEELKEDEQKLKKLVRDTSNVHGTSKERKLLEQHSWLDNLNEKAATTSAWQKVSKLNSI
jgi:hypothetical protein